MFGIRLSLGMLFFREDFIEQRQERPWQMLLTVEPCEFLNSLIYSIMSGA